MVDLSKIVSFEWDKGNIDKSYQKHGVSLNEAEEVFLDKDIQIEKDVKHQEKEERFIAIGKIQQVKILFVVFTIRKDRIRIISAREANKKERRLGGYMKKALKKIPKFKNEKEERKFWQTHDSTEYVEYKSLENWSFPNLKLSTKPITLRLPAGMIDRLKIKAHKMDVPYQALIKQMLFDSLSKQ